jgi:surface protein
MFNGCKKFNQSIDSWVDSRDVSKWDVGRVTSMQLMFFDCHMYNQPLNNWDVSNVTNMEAMFTNCYAFNKPLDRWNVGRVTNMNNMFAFCTTYNQPLNNWNVSNVTNMEAMFSHCYVFNKPLYNWNVSRVTNMNDMFNSCFSFSQVLRNWNVSNVIVTPDIVRAMFLNSINEGNRPRFILQGQPIQTPRRVVDRVVDPLQIHRESSKINYQKLINFLKKKSGDKEMPSNLNFAKFIEGSINIIIDECFKTPSLPNAHFSPTSPDHPPPSLPNAHFSPTSPDHPPPSSPISGGNGLNETKKGFHEIMKQRLKTLRYSEKSPNILRSIFYALEYVKLQPLKFKKIYVKTFVYECVTAYDGPNGMTCADGALERIVNSLINPCQSLLTMEEYKNNTDYKKIIAIISALDPNKLALEYITDWYKYHYSKGPNAFSPGKSQEDKIKDLKKYLSERLEGETDEFIDLKIKEYAQGFEDDDFEYQGGRRRKTRKYRKINRKSRKLLLHNQSV